MKVMQNVLTFPPFNEGQSTGFIFKGISPNHTIGCNLFETKTFHKINENLYAAESGHSCSQVWHTHCQLFFKEALFRNSSCIVLQKIGGYLLIPGSVDTLRYRLWSCKNYKITSPNNLSFSYHWIVPTHCHNRNRTL